LSHYRHSFASNQYSVMEVPFYLTYKEFENTYYDNLERWFEQEGNSSETDYLKHLAHLYAPYLYYNFSLERLQADASVKIKDCFFPYYEKIGISFCTGCDHGKAKDAEKMNHVFEWKTISMMEYAQHILDKVNDHISRNWIILNNGQCILDYLSNREVVTFRNGAGYCVDFSQHLSVLPFLKAYLPCSGKTVNMAVYRDFLFSVVQIAEHIDRRLKDVHAFESTIGNRLKSDAKFRIQVNQHFLTFCN